MSIGTGIAIAGACIGVAIFCFTPVGQTAIILITTAAVLAGFCWIDR